MKLVAVIVGEIYIKCFEFKISLKNLNNNSLFILKNSFSIQSILIAASIDQMLF